jgi:hypothetical protein
MPIKKLRRFLKRAFDRIRNEKLKQNLLQAIPFWVASLVTGLIAVFYSRVYAYLESRTFLVIQYHSWQIFILNPV